MKQSLQLRLGQQLTMTPQLQQAIRLLQLSTLDLQMEIQQQLESNVMLELAEEDQQETEQRTEEGETQDTEGERGDEASTEEATEAGTAGEETAAQEQADIPEDLPLDSNWDDIYDGSTPWSQPDSEDEDRDPYANRSGGGETLHDHLTWQAELTPFTDRDAAIAQVIIDSVRDDGYLGAGIEELISALPAEWAVEPDEVEAVLRRIQHFDPVGVAARDPREALLIQLEQLPPDTPLLPEARRLVDLHLDMLVQRQYAQLCRRMKLNQDQLREVLGLIQTLDPRPGSQIGGDETQYVVPDVVVRRSDGRWQVELNPATAPRLRVNSYYASLIKRADNSSDNTTLRNHLQEARWFIKSLLSRNDTLLKVARCIVERQQGYFDHGEEAMQPLVLREVAEAVDMHESTISRITTRKYMHTPRGTLEFKYFFSSHVQTVDGGECSATAIRARIRRLIADENPTKPLSDSRIANILQEEGINVARRTVAKYREAMAIASSSERKRLA
ncbi:RNA polymerase factor sigma-54 [Alkalilimnicola ehrlichii MLHE-1]|nr:RNA polymerase factor sigma-54 [Alkalilimnicola ehrlichii]